MVRRGVSGVMRRWCEEELVGVVRGSASGEGGGVGRCGEGWERGAISRS